MTSLPDHCRAGDPPLRVHRNGSYSLISADNATTIKANECKMRKQNAPKRKTVPNFWFTNSSSSVECWQSRSTVVRTTVTAAKSTRVQLDYSRKEISPAVVLYVKVHIKDANMFILMHM